MEFNLENSVNHQIANLAVLLKRQVYRIISQNNIEITPEQWIVLYYLWGEDGLTIGEIAKRSKKDYGNITRIVDKLVRLNYVNKTRDMDDNRVSHVFLQPRADEIKEGIHNCWLQSTNIALAGFDDKEQEIMLSYLSRIEENIIKGAEQSL